MVYQGNNNIIMMDVITVFWNILLSWCVIFAGRNVAVRRLPRMISGPFFIALCNSELQSRPIKSAVHFQDNCSGGKLSWPQGQLDRIKWAKWMSWEVHTEMFQTKWQQKKIALKNWDSLKLLPSVFHQKFPWTSQTCLACNTCVCLIAFIVLLLGDSVQITAVRQSSVKAPEYCKNSQKTNANK